MKKQRWLWLVLTSCLGSCTCLAVCVAAIFAAPHLEEVQFEQEITIGQPAPDFNLPGLAGGEIQLSKYTGTPVLLTIGATWWPTCQDELQVLQRLHEEYPDMKVLLVNTGEPASVARPYYRKSGATVTIALDEDSQVNRLYHVYALPTIVFIDRQGIIQQVNIGHLGAPTLQEGLQAIGVR